MTPAIAYQEMVDETSATLGWIKRGLNEEERVHLGVELMDVTRLEDDEAYQAVLAPWILTVMARGHPDFMHQVKEFNNILQANELFSSVDLGSLERPT